MNNILIIDSNSKMANDITHTFRNDGFTITDAADFESAAAIIKQRDFDVIISDTNIRGGTLDELLEYDTRTGTKPIVIVSAGHQNLEEALKAVEAGAFDVIRKPYRIPELEVKIKNALKIRKLEYEADNLRGERDIIYKAENFIGESPGIKEIFEIVKKIAKSSSSVLLLGETGTGKELLAGAIHYNSLRKENAFIKVNCAALPEHLLESELFGHEKGAFTGADRQRIGRFEQADGGTIFLDEIGDMSLATQAKVLRVLQEKEFQRVGGNKTIKVDVRIISATNKDLIHEIQEKRFRTDLYYRLNVVTITLPPLRARRGDILLLTYFFLKRLTGDLKKKISEIHPLAIKQLTEYSWPGNIRELENTIERAILLADDGIIRPEDLHLPYQTDFVQWDYNAIRIPLKGIKLEEVERRLVLQSLKMCDWVQKDAAKLLGVSQRVLNYKIKRFGITHPRWKKYR